MQQCQHLRPLWASKRPIVTCFDCHFDVKKLKKSKNASWAPWFIHKSKVAVWFFHKSKGTIPNTQMSSNGSWTKCHKTSSIKIFLEGKTTWGSLNKVYRCNQPYSHELRSWQDLLLQTTTYSKKVFFDQLVMFLMGWWKCPQCPFKSTCIWKWLFVIHQLQWLAQVMRVK